MADNNNNEHNANADSGISRRTFIKNTGLVTGGIIGGGLLGGMIGNQWQTDTQTETAGETDENGDTNDFDEARIFFDRDEDFNVLSAATEKIFPEDENGPGAIELGVPYFIDKQLAGRWGENTMDYMRSPFQEDEPALNRGKVFLQGVRKMDNLSENEYGEIFVDLNDDQQIEVLQAFANGDVEMEKVNASHFFDLLRQGTLEGVYSDPLYGGNKNMAGWKMKEYPGVHMSHNNIVEEEEFVEIEPVSLSENQ